MKHNSTEEINVLTNQGEHKNFLKTVFTLRGSVTPKVIFRVIVSVLFSVFVMILPEAHPSFSKISISVSPFEYSSAVLGLLLVLRVNAGMDRWWEARIIWGSIVNQSRNLGIIICSYGCESVSLRRDFVHWVAAWPHVMRASLRKERLSKSVINLLGEAHAAKIESVNHMPSFMGLVIAEKLSAMRSQGLDNFAFQRAERERALLIDAIGACERILTTPIPLVLAIQIRRFLFLFLFLLPFALVDQVGWLTPLITLIVSYPLFALDEIGAELQSPFSPRNLSHLPLTTICSTIERNLLEIAGERESLP